jgi:radical SAM superfamily enzyme YgiQ (UPF0313 family)
VEESRRLGFGGRLDADSIPVVYQRNHSNPYLHSILMWQSGGGRTAFLQDANNLVHAPDDLAEMLKFLRETLPIIERVTSYARSSTLAKWAAADLARVREAGLNRVHVGLESGSDAVLKLVNKGVTQAAQIEAGRKAKAAGMELSEYVMPGLGGRALSEDHARETARALNAIDPHFIRLRSLGLRDGMPLYEKVKSGDFEIMNDLEMAREIRLFVEGLEGINSIIVSDHVLNLLPEVEGKLPEDKDQILAVIDEFLDLPEEDQLTYVVGRRMGAFEGLDDLADPCRAAPARKALAAVREQGGGDVYETIRQIMSQFI